MSSLESESDDSQEYASIPTSPGVEYASEHDNDYDTDETDDGSPDTRTGTEPKGKDKDTAKQDTFRVLVTGFGPYGQWEVNPSWLAVKPLHNVVLQTDPANHPRASLPDDKSPPPLDEKLLTPRPIHISTLEIPTTYRSILKIVPGLHLRPPVLPEKMKDPTVVPPENGYDFMFHIGLAGRGPLRLERCGHKLGYNMKDATGKYAPVVIPQTKDFRRRGPDGRPMTIAEKAERERLALAAASEIQSNPPGDSSTKPNRGFGGSDYEAFSDELSTDLDVTRIVQDMRQTGVEALQTIYSSMDGGHFVGDFVYYCSLAESKRSANPYEKRRNTQVLFLHCAPVGYPLKSEEVTDAIKRIVLWVCNEIQMSTTDDAPDLPPVGTKNNSMPGRFQPLPIDGSGASKQPSHVSTPPANTTPAQPPPVQPLPPPLAEPLPSPPVGPPPPVQPPPVHPYVTLPLPAQPPTFSPPSTISSPVSSTNDSEYHSTSQDD